MYEPVAVDLFSSLLAIFLGTVFVMSFLLTSAGVGAQEEQSLSSRESLLSHFQDDEDIYAILTGDQDYLAAHVTLKEEPLPKPRPRQVVRTHTAKPKVVKPKVVKPKVVKPKVVKPSGTQFGADCSIALTNLGYKKSDANRLVNEMLTNNPNIKDVQTFITEAFKK